MRYPVSLRPTTILLISLTLPALASSIIVMHACLACNYPKALSHCGHGHDLTSAAQLSVVNIADVRSAFVETLASERFCRNAVDCVP